MKPARFLPALLVALLLALVRPAAANGLALASVATAGSEGVFLAQVAARSDGTPLPQVRLTDAPAFPQSLTLTREQINSFLQKAAPELAPASWSGADKVRVSRRVRSLGESELKEALTAQLQRDHAHGRGELELTFTRAWTPVALPDEPFTLKVLDLPASGLGPNVVLRFELRGAKETFGSWQVAVLARAWGDVLITRNTLKRGQLLGESDLLRERRDLLTARAALVELPAAETGLELIENVGAGAALTARSFRPRPLIARGQTVDAIVQEGGLNISLRVEVLQDGLPGQTVRVRNLQSKREFYGKVHNEHTILVSL